MRQKWDFSQIEDSVEEGDVMDWHEHDEVKKQWEDVSKKEVKIVQRKTAKEKKETRKGDRMVYEEGGEANKRPVKDTEKMVSWRNINQQEINVVCVKLALTIEEEVLEKYNVEDSHVGVPNRRRC